MKILDLYITDVCNLSCEYCYVDIVKKEKTSFNKDEFISRVDLLAFDSIKFLGWEPLIKWQDIKQIIESVSAKNSEITFTIITNGVLLDSKKIEFIQKYENVEVLVSLHDWALPQIRKKTEILKQLENRISFYIIFDPTNFTASIQKFLEFFRYGFTSFCFAPEIYAHWDNTNLRSLEKILSILSKTIISHSIQIWWVPKNFLKTMNYGCEKFIYNKSGEYNACNRFRALEKQDNFNYNTVYEYFQEKIDYKNDSNRWFYVCPVWWYLDNEEDIDSKIISYKQLNTIFLDFHRKVNGDTLNFLHKGISEIRFNLTRQCNIRCEYCYVDFTNDALPFMEAKNIVDFILEQEWEVNTFSFFWGEPLLQRDLLQKIVGYISKKNQQTQKQVYYKIATNFMLMNDDTMNFLVNHNFEIHISLNGVKNLNDTMRDNSTQRVLQNIHKYSNDLHPNNTVILLAFSPNEVANIYESILFMFSLWFKRINFELIFWDNISWKKEDIKKAVKQIYLAFRSWQLVIENIDANRNTFLDIDTRWRCSDNSLEFYWKKVDSDNKQYLDTLLSHTCKNDKKK